MDEADGLPEVLRSKLQQSGLLCLMLLDLPASRADWIPPARPGPGPPIRGQVQRQPGQGGERRRYFVPAPFRSHNGSWKETDEATEASISRNNNSLYGHFVICTRNNENKTWPRPWPLEFIATSSPARSVAGLFPVGWPIPKRAFKPRSGSPRYTQASNSEHSLLPAPEVDRPRRSAKGNTNPHEAIQIQIMADVFRQQTGAFVQYASSSKPVANDGISATTRLVSYVQPFLELRE